MSTARAPLDVCRHRVAVVNFTGFRDNWGCQATSWEAVKWLQGALPERHAAEVFLVPLLPRCDVDAQLYERRTELGEAIRAACDRTGNWRDALASLEQLCLTRYGDYAVRTRQSDPILFQDRLPSASWIVLPPHLPYPAVAAALGRSQFLLSGRYHMNILAAAQLTPVIQLRGNSWKNEGLNGLLDRTMPMFDFAAEDAVAEAAGSLMSARSHVQERLQGAMAGAHGRLQQSADWLRQLLEGRTDRMAPALQGLLGHVVSALDCYEPY